MYMVKVFGEIKNDCWQLVSFAIVGACYWQATVNIYY